MDYPNLTIVAPDAGGAERARAYAKRLNAELAVIDKRRTDDGTAEVMNVIGDVAGPDLHHPGRHHRHGRDDHEGGDGAEGQRRRADLRVRGARRAVGAGDRADREVADRQADRDQHDPARPATRRRCEKIEVLSVARLLGQAIKSIHEETSVSSLFV